MDLSIPAGKRPWQKSSRVLNWEFARLSGTGGTLVSGPSTLLARCHAPVSYPVWVCDELTEYFLLKGRLIINNQQCEAGDYVAIGMGVDQVLQSEGAMELLAIMHGRYVFPPRVFDAIRDMTIGESDALSLSRRPWVDVLRRHALEEHGAILSSCFERTHSDAIRTLCIGMARQLKAPTMITAVERLLQANGEIELETRIGAFLFLASKGKMTEVQWKRELGLCDMNREGVLRVMERFHNATSGAKLKASVEERLESADYKLNRPFYEFVLGIMDRK